MIEVCKPGLQTTIQDGGRPGYLSKGIPPSGAQDNYAFRLASLLVGNHVPPPLLTLEDPGDAGLEILLNGPTLRFREAAVIAITGADMTATLDGESLPMWESVYVPDGSVLDLGRARSGVRGYLAISGGIQVPTYLGSRATYLQGRLGGLEGRPLMEGDVLSLGPPSDSSAALAGRRVRSDLVPKAGPPWEVRTVVGPQAHLFMQESVAEFFRSEWKLSASSDRRGFRFTGPRLEFRDRPAYLSVHAGSDPSNIVDDVTPLGGIQVPGGIEPIVMGVDLPSLGGYAKIATVISADMGRVGQIRPNEICHFVPVELEEALALGASQADAVCQDALAEA